MWSEQCNMSPVSLGALGWWAGCSELPQKAVEEAPPSGANSYLCGEEAWRWRGRKVPAHTEAKQRLALIATSACAGQALDSECARFYPDNETESHCLNHWETVSVRSDALVWMQAIILVDVSVIVQLDSDTHKKPVKVSKSVWVGCRFVGRLVGVSKSSAWGWKLWEETEGGAPRGNQQNTGNAFNWKPVPVCGRGKLDL